MSSDYEILINEPGFVDEELDDESAWGQGTGFIDGLENAFDATMFPPDLHAIQIVNDLPPLPDDRYPHGAFVFLTQDSKLYKSLGDVWTPAVLAEDIQGQIGYDQIQPGVYDQIIADSLIVGQAAFAAIAVDMIQAAELTAEQITSGSLTIGGASTDANAEMLLVRDAQGDEIGRWDQLGLILHDVSNPALAMRFVDGRLEFSSDDFATNPAVAISGAGIYANAITIGDMPGGHNSVRNAGFEIVNRESFVVPVIKLWDTSADWGTTISTDVNILKTGASLTLASAAY